MKRNVGFGTILDVNGIPFTSVMDLAGNNRLAVDANITAVSLSSLTNECNIVFMDITTISTKSDVTIRTYTVPNGKSFRIVTFQAMADHPLAIDIVLRVAGVDKIKFYLDPSQGSDNANFMTSPALIATSGQVVTIIASPTMPRGEINTILTGIEL